MVNIKLWLQQFLRVSPVLVVLAGGIGLVLPLNVQAELGFAATYPVGELGPEVGDVLVYNPRSGNFGLADQVSSPYIFGVAAQTPTIVFQTDPEYWPVVRSGETAVRVSDINGPIQAGTFITTSELTGVAQRAEAQHGFVVGLALESFSGEEGEETATAPDGREVALGQIMVDIRPGIRPPRETMLTGVAPDFLEPEPKPEEPAEPAEPGVGDVIREGGGALIDAASVASERLRDYQMSETGSRVTQAISTSGVVVGGVTVAGSLFFNPLLLFELLMIPFRIWILIMYALGLRQRQAPWGTVFDSVTKQPLDPAYVTLEDMEGREVDSSITDLDGRYGFLVEPGKYRLKAEKTNYLFPSKKLAGKKEDDVYEDLYFGQPIEIKKTGDILTYNIPMDPEKFDWNEFTKQSRRLNTFFSQANYVKDQAVLWLFRVGLVTALAAAVFNPQWYNILILLAYGFVFLLRYATDDRRWRYGVVTENKAPLPFAVVRVYLPDSGQEVARAVSDKYGRYYMLVNNGRYYAIIDKKMGEDTYQKVHTSDVFEVKRGMVAEKFEV